MTAVHFGAGNIGRGFIGLLLHQAGHHVVFVDVATELIDAINSADSYRVIETGAGARKYTVDNFSGVNSAQDADSVVRAIAGAEIVTTAVGPRILPFVAPLVARALESRTIEAPLAVMACENAIGATDVLKEAVAKLCDAETLARGRFANTAVDRIVPAQDASNGLDVVVESFCEWVIELTPFGGDVPRIPGAHFVDDLAPYIERKLLTVNTGHATTAYLGKQAGYEYVAEAIADPTILSTVQRVLAETTEMLVRRHGIDRDAQGTYASKTIERFRNDALRDAVDRVGRQPLRKLSRHERLIEPAAALAEAGVRPAALLSAIDAALHFDVADDPESVEMLNKLATLSAQDFVATVCGIEPGHPLHADLVDVVARAQ